MKGSDDMPPQTSTCPAGVTCTPHGYCSAGSVKVARTEPCLARLTCLLQNRIQLVTMFGEDRMKFWDRPTDRQTDRQTGKVTPI
ncbi:hypothetical protein DPMN_183734 [Dreissena polymorpha]|uniref:Uncharacterized protein n=1 Tax=Dreissena polymorpha TaxID=45954 RepID=A0A9D4DHK3_DREPO|nr:hypothetical protein DPMN_183734 [Dreissena polymorpha]